jgi:hypothetical protein
MRDQMDFLIGTASCYLVFENKLFTDCSLSLFQVRLGCLSPDSGLDGRISFKAQSASCSAAIMSGVLH